MRTPTLSSFFLASLFLFSIAATTKDGQNRAVHPRHSGEGDGDDNNSYTHDMTGMNMTGSSKNSSASTTASKTTNSTMTVKATATADSHSGGSGNGSGSSAGVNGPSWELGLVGLLSALGVFGGLVGNIM